MYRCRSTPLLSTDHACRPVDEEAEQALREALLADVEAGQESMHWTARGHKQSWMKLLAIAAKYMWPEERNLQVIELCVCGGDSGSYDDIMSHPGFAPHLCSCVRLSVCCLL